MHAAHLYVVGLAALLLVVACGPSDAERYNDELDEILSGAAAALDQWRAANAISNEQDPQRLTETEAADWLARRVAASERLYGEYEEAIEAMRALRPPSQCDAAHLAFLDGLVLSREAYGAFLGAMEMWGQTGVFNAAMPEQAGLLIAQANVAHERAWFHLVSCS